MDSRYENRLTDLAKRLRPLMVNVAESVVAGSGDYVPYAVPVSAYDTDLGTWPARNDGTFLFRLDTGDNIKVIGMGQAKKSAPIAYAHFGTNSAGTGNIYCKLTVTHYRANSTTFTTYNSGAQAIAIGGHGPTNWYWYKPAALAVTITNAQKGDIIRFLFDRYGSSGSDTFNAYVDFLGFTLE